MHNLILFAGLMSFMLYFGTYIRVPVIPLFAQEIGASTVEIGFMSGAFMLSATICAIPFGLLSDRFGRKALLLSAVFISAAASFMIAFSTTVTHLFLLGLFGGIGIAAFTPAMMSYVGDIATSANIGRYYGIYTTAIYLGMTVGPIIGGLYAEHYGYTNTFILSAFAALLSLLIGALKVQSKSTHKTQTETGSLFASIKKLLKIKKYMGALIATFSLCFCWGGLMAFLPIYAKSIGISTASIGLLYGFQSVFNTVSRFPSGYFIDKTGSKSYFILAGLILVSPSIAVIGFLDSFLLLILPVSITGFGMGISFSAIGSLISEVVPANTRGTAMGLYSTLIYGGLMVSSVLTGPVIEISGYKAAYMFLGITSTIGTVFFHHLTGDKIETV